MSLKEQLVKYFGFSEMDWEITTNYLDGMSLKAKEFFLRQGKVSDKIGIIKSGLLRSYYFDENGNEITIQFHIPGTVVISNESFNNQIKLISYISGSTVSEENRWFEMIASMFSYFQKVPEQGNPEEAYKLLGKPEITLNKWMDSLKN